MQWHLIIEEFGPTMEYIKGPKNIVADTLSRLEMTSDTESLDMADCYGLDSNDLPDNAFLISYTLIDWKQKKDKALLKQAQTGSYSLKKFHGGGATVCLLCFKDKIVIPTSLTKQIVQWYHYLLCHPSINRTEEIIGQHFYWPEMRDQITNDISICAICQTQKKQSKKYGLLPEKEAEVMPWDRLCVDLIGPYNVKSNVKGVKIPPLKCITMIDPATGWFEIKQYDDKKSITVTNIVEQEWLMHYP
jgi:hypothetical protein